MRTRKTVDAWEIHVNYGQGWEHECTELTRAAMRENARAYRENCPFPIRIKKRRMRIADMTDNEKRAAGIGGAP